LKVTYLGHAAFQIEAAGLNALIDPFISYSPLAPKKVEDYTNVNYILVTHGHGDHLGDTVRLAKTNSATVIANAEICGYLTKKGVTCHAMHIGGSYRFSFGKVKLTPALHGSAIESDETLIEGGNPCGFLLNIEGHKIYHAGDTGLTKDMELLAEEQVDLALLPIGGNFTMDVQDAARAVRMIQPHKVIPMHYNTFPVIQADPLEFVSLVDGAAQVIVLKPGEMVNL